MWRSHRFRDVKLIAVYLFDSISIAFQFLLRDFLLVVSHKSLLSLIEYNTLKL